MTTSYCNSAAAALVHDKEVVFAQFNVVLSDYWIKIILHYLMLHYINVALVVAVLLCVVLFDITLFNVVISDIALFTATLFNVALCWLFGVALFSVEFYLFTKLVLPYSQGSMQRGICTSKISSFTNDMKLKITLLILLDKRC